MSFITLLSGDVSYLKCDGEKCQVILSAIEKGPVRRFLPVETIHTMHVREPRVGSLRRMSWPNVMVLGSHEIRAGEILRG